MALSPETKRQYQTEYRAMYRAAGRDRTRVTAHNRPFVAIDGEGGNLESGYHAYFLLVAGQRRLLPSAGNVRLTSRECLDFIADLDPYSVYVAYFFDYDVTKILEDLPWPKLSRLINRKERERKDYGLFPVDYSDFQLDYLPRKEFKVRRVLNDSRTRFGPWIVINDVGSFFQCRFVEALEKWKIGTEDQRAAIEAGKKKRGHFRYEDLAEIEEYNALEIETLEALMDRFRQACRLTGYLPARWQGPGLLAESMLSAHGVRPSREIPLFQDERYNGLSIFAANAFYGGRPEISCVGPINRPVYQFDLNSAYPNAMQYVPCLIHGKWTYAEERCDAKELPDDCIVFGSFEDATKENEHRPAYYGLPTRTDEGTIVYPASGRGWYWNFEVRASVHQRFRVESYWRYTKRCDCAPLAFVRDVYLKRQDLGKDDAGIVLKLALNSLYGKTVQSIGRPKYANPIWGSFITAHCRTSIQKFIHGSEFCANGWCGKDVAMIATDSVATWNPRNDIEPNKELGGWSVDEHSSGMFIVQPGLYFGSAGKHSKTRGVPRELVDEKEQEFRQAFSRMVQSRSLSDGDVTVPQSIFVGIRYALHRRNLKLMGQWIEFRDSETGKSGKTIKFDWSSKRARFPTLAPLPGVHDYIETFPQEGPICTVPYSRNIGGLVARELERNAFKDQPDWSPSIDLAQDVAD